METIGIVKFVMPARINADGLLPLVSMMGCSIPPDETVEVDFSPLQRVSPAALSVLVANVTRWKREGRVVIFNGVERCAIAGYLQRMDVFRQCGVDVAEGFRRHDARGRFVPLRRIDHRVDELGSYMAGCIAPGGDDYEHPLAALYYLAFYVLTETAANARQHSGGEGFAVAQVGQAEGLVRLAVADNGRGILDSFRQVEMEWSLRATDAEAIETALEPRVLSRGSPTNEGVGLTLMTQLVRLTGAWMLIVSGTGLLRLGPKQPIKTGVLTGAGRYQCTLIALTFMQKRVHDYALLLRQAKVEAGLLPKGGDSGRFRP